MRSIFEGSIPFILRDTEYIRALILFILSNTQYYWGVDTAFIIRVDTVYAKRYAGFSGVDIASTK